MAKNIIQLPNKPIVKQNAPPPRVVTTGAPVLAPSSYWNGLPASWNPGLPPPTIIPTKGVMQSPDIYNFPGGIYGATWEDVQMLIRKQIKTQGLNAQTVASTRNTFPIRLSGTAKILMGILFGGFTGLLTKVSLFVNNEQIITDVAPFSLCNIISANIASIDYFSIPRPLSGSDDIILVIDEVAGVNTTYPVTFFYL
jgi:hypothetical protein